ncbi:MAG TPA: TaqI-like C-terminal specificity domain-containing protein, partial [Longimicrobium sp.]|nr:TaqI-like C-terminal specificity domain-containing protein [Longimicrobium sp.]
PGDALAAYVAENAYGVPRARFGAAPWSLEPRAVEALMEKLRGAGVPLREYAGSAPLYGIRTGPADAFVVDEETRQRILAHDPAAASLLHPFLRAQDVERWAPAWAGLWMIALRSGADHAWPWTGAPADRAERVFAQTFPGVHAHLKPHEDRLRARAEQGQHWWELRGCGYYDAFEAPKLVWRDLSFHSAFCVDVDGLYTHDLCFVLPTEDRWLAAVLNSPLMWFFMWRTVVHGKDEVLRLKNVYMETLPIVHPTGAVRVEASQSVDRLVELTREKRGLEREMAEWLRAEYGVAQPSERLEAFADLSASDFVEEVKRRRPKKADALAPREVGLLRNAHAEYAPRLTAVQAKIAGLERRLSQMVSRAYGLTPEEVELMWSTAPPRMPVGR